MNEQRQFERYCKLIIGLNSSNALDVSNLRIVFKITKADMKTPNKGNITIYNLSLPTAARIQKEFTRVELSAGYVDNNGIIFKGNVRQVRTGKENGTDRYLSLDIGDGDQGFNFAVINSTLAAGATPRDEVDALLTSLEPYGITEGYIDIPNTTQSPRAAAMTGMTRDYLTDVCTSNNCDWSIQDETLQITPLTSTLPGEAIVLSPSSGLVESPEIVNGGLSVRCLINPRLKIGARIKIAGTEDKDGIYRILKLSYSGDTWGGDWTATIVGLNADPTVARQQQVANQ